MLATAANSTNRLGQRAGADAVVGSAIVSVKLVPKIAKFGCFLAAGGLSQCLPATGNSTGVVNGTTFSAFDSCEAACLPKPPPPPPPPMRPGALYPNTDIDGVQLGSDSAPVTWQGCNASCANTMHCAAFVFDNRTGGTHCPEGACCWHKAEPVKPMFSPGRLAMLMPLPVQLPGWYGPIESTYADAQCPNIGCHKGLKGVPGAAGLEALCDKAAGCTAFNLDASGGGCLRACAPARVTRYNESGMGCCSYYRVGPPKQAAAA